MGYRPPRPNEPEPPLVRHLDLAIVLVWFVATPLIVAGVIAWARLAL